MKTIHVGKNNKIKNINECLNIIDSPTLIILDDDIYYEKVVINKDNIIIDGMNHAKIIYDDYALKIHQDGREYVTFRTYTLLVKSNHVTLRNLTIENSAGEGHVVGQAVALHLYGDDINVINSKLIAKQDTIFLGPLSKDLIERYVDLLPLDEREYSSTFNHKIIDSTIEGTVDFIFGGSNCDFINCNIVSLKHDKDTYVIAPNHEKEVTYGFNFINCKFLKEDGVKDNSVYLARPWREYGLINIKDSFMDSHIKKEGYSIWEGTDRHLHSRFSESGSFGPGASKDRVSWIKIK